LYYWNNELAAAKVWDTITKNIAKFNFMYCDNKMKGFLGTCAPSYAHEARYNGAQANEASFRLIS